VLNLESWTDLEFWFRKRLRVRVSCRASCSSSAWRPYLVTQSDRQTTLHGTIRISLESGCHTFLCDARQNRSDEFCGNRPMRPWNVRYGFVLRLQCFLRARTVTVTVTRIAKLRLRFTLQASCSMLRLRYLVPVRLFSQGLSQTVFTAVTPRYIMACICHG
jgi:hypothetical protein